MLGPKSNTSDRYRVIATDGSEHWAGQLRSREEALYIFGRAVAAQKIAPHGARRTGLKVMAEPEYQRVYGGAQ